MIVVNPSDGRWNVRIDGRDVAQVMLADAQVGPFRVMLADVSGAVVSLGLAMHMEGTLVTYREPAPGDRVCFNARLFGPSDPYQGTPVVLSGVVIRPVWGRARNVSILSDGGRRYCRTESAVW